MTLQPPRQFGFADPRLTQLAARPYDLTILCAPDFPFVQDGTRRDPAFRDRGHQWYVARLEELRQRWLLVEGPLAERVWRVRDALE